jgi:IclR family pca regulon transcriptional regulator
MSRLRPADAQNRLDRDVGADFSEALARGLKVIGAFDSDRTQLSLSDLARLVDLPRATARRALNTLKALGYVESDGRLFRLTPKILTLASAYLSANATTAILQPACERICAAVNLSCTAAVLDGDDAVMIARALPAQAIPIGLGIGYRLPAFCSALGRVLLSALPDPNLDAWLAALTPVAQTPTTVLDKQALKAAILKVRADGFSYVDQEAEFGFHSIAVPLKRFDGRPVAALNIGARVDRADRETMTGAHLQRLVAEAQGLSRALI